MFYNGLQLTEVGDYEAETFKFKQMYNRSRNVDTTTEPPILVRCCYRLGFLPQSGIKNGQKNLIYKKKELKSGMQTIAVGFFMPKVKTSLLNSIRCFITEASLSLADNVAFTNVFKINN